MAGPPLVYAPPSYNTQNVLFGIGILFTAAVGTAVPSDQNLGVGSAWTGLGWAYVGATEAGVTVTFNPTVQNITIEEQPTPVGVAVSTADLQVVTSMSEETLTNVNVAWGNGGTVAVTPPGAGQPGKSVLTLSTTFQNMACAVVGKNQLGFARVLSIPTVVSAGQVQTAYRRAAQQRLYPLTLTAICPFNQITWTDLTAIATS
ncbi:MAG TPA: hypothetical protein VGI66_00985 [Streptosporangiaceae bacterium]|jgi:hypothetical protein